MHMQTRTAYICICACKTLHEHAIFTQSKGHRGNPCTARASRTLCATFRLDSPVKNPHTNPFQTPKLGHPSYTSLRQLGTTCASHQMP